MVGRAFAASSTSRTQNRRLPSSELIFHGNCKIQGCKAQHSCACRGGAHCALSLEAGAAGDGDGDVASAACAARCRSPPPSPPSAPAPTASGPLSGKPTAPGPSLRSARLSQASLTAAVARVDARAGARGAGSALATLRVSSPDHAGNPKEIVVVGHRDPTHLRSAGGAGTPLTTSTPYCNTGTLTHSVSRSTCRPVHTVHADIPRKSHKNILVSW